MAPTPHQPKQLQNFTLHAEADKLKAETDGVKTENYRKFVELVDENIKGYSEQGALRLKLAKLVETFPELEEKLAQLEQYKSEYGLRILSIDQDGEPEA